MFDNPKKELERLEQQLLASESFDEEAFEDSSDDIDVLFDDREFARRSAGFDIQDGDYRMDTARYVPAPKKKSRGRLLFTCLILGLAALIAWRMGWLS